MNQALKYDLHSHSIISDGTLSPKALVAHAAECGIDVFALTDHDNIDGLAEAELAAKQHGITLINGVEVSVSWNKRTVHIVGLGIDPENKDLKNGLAKLTDYRFSRAHLISERLAKSGIPDAYEGAGKYAKGALIGRLHFARFLVERGHATSIREVFKKFLVKNKPGFVSGEWAGLEQAVSWITNAGGQAVIAHPARYGLTRTKLLGLINDFKACGGTAIEVVSGSHTKEESLTIAAHARTLDLLGSTGSDYHGPENPYVEIGRLPPLPDGVIPVWHDWELT